jgi:Protein of unknown function (DUF3224)
MLHSTVEKVLDTFSHNHRLILNHSPIVITFFYINSPNKKKEILIMQKNKLFSVAIALVLIAFFTTGWVSPKPTPTTPQAVTITGTYDFSTFPHVTGTFVYAGALTISGTNTMHIGPNIKGAIAHCVEIETASDGSGTITIHMECAFNTPIPQGRWEIVSGTGAYTNLKGNGSLTMPGTSEAMVGVIY